MYCIRLNELMFPMMASLKRVFFFFFDSFFTLKAQRVVDKR